ncbi:MAG: carbamoyltransferase N-terminal domain-containing protein [Terriglobales bacterium]
MIILGINAYHGDVSAVLVRDGVLVAAVEEERFRRIKHWAGCPRDSIFSCLEMAGARPSEIDYFAVSRNPRANLLRKGWFAAFGGPKLSLVKDRAKNSSLVRDLPARIAATLRLDAEAVRKRMHWVEHHPAHLASSFFLSPFDQAAVCAIDGFGDFVSTSMATGQGSTLKLLDKVYFPHSLGMLYLAITQYLGFMKYGDEFKVMGLAPYGKPEYADAIRRLVRLVPGGRFELDLSYFRHWNGDVPMTWNDGEPLVGPVYSSKLEQLLGPARKPSEPVEPRHEAIAASLQAVYEEAAFHVLNRLHERTHLDNLCLAGGCAMNSVANGKVRERTPFRKVYIQPAAGDNGTALGAAYFVWNQVLGKPRDFQMQHGYWGPEFDDAAFEQALEERQSDAALQSCRAQVIKDEGDLCRWTAERIAAGEVVGWFQADPRREDMREIINTKIKFREKFRPFAPSIMEEAVNEYFVGACPDPFMIQVYPVQPAKRNVIPAVTHVDGSGRLQTVSQRSNPRYWRLIKSFEQITGVPVVLNTSFNENEPIVLKPAEALDCFLRTRMDHIVLGNHTVSKANL